MFKKFSLSAKAYRNKYCNKSKKGS